MALRQKIPGKGEGFNGGHNTGDGLVQRSEIAISPKGQAGAGGKTGKVREPEVWQEQADNRVLDSGSFARKLKQMQQTI